MAQTVATSPTNGTPTADAQVTESDSTNRTERQVLLDDVRKSVIADVDEKVAEKMKALWSNGNKMLKKIEQDSHEKNSKLQNELEVCRNKQAVLQAEHDHLNAVLTDMVQHFNTLGNLFGAPAGTKMTAIPPGLVPANGTAASTTAADSSAADSSSASACGSTLQDSPSGLSAPDVVFGGNFPPLPAVPDFPFPSTSAATTPLSVATPLSLAEALHSKASSPSVPVSLMGALPQHQLPSGTRMFSFTLRKADGTDLGLNVSHTEDDKALTVEGVRPEGAVEAWNRQCTGSTASEKAVCTGDRIVSVNGVINDPIKMLEECRDRQLLKLTVVRTDREAVATPKSSITLRADASEFVPGGAAPGLSVVTEEESKKDDGSSRTDKATEC